MDTLLRIMIFFAIGLNMASCNPDTTKKSKAPSDHTASSAQHQNTKS